MKVSPSIKAFEPGEPVSTPVGAAAARRPSRLMQKLRRWRGLLLCVVLPVLIAAGYYYGVAAGQYASEARVLIRGPGRAGGAGGSGPMSEMLSASGFTAAAAESMAVRDFLRSGDAIRAISPAVDLIAIWRRPEADFLARLQDENPSSEALLRYYNRMVAADLDSESGSVTLQVRAFRAEDAEAVTEALLRASEALVNRLSARQREDTLGTARTELQRAEARVVAAREALTQFRQNERALDPTREAAANLDNVSRLEATLAATRAELAEKSFYLRADNPQVATLRNRIATMERQIVEERGRLTTGEAVLPQRLADYERLMLEREFADRQLGSATSGLEAARVDVARQQLYLARVVEPRRAETAQYPKAAFTLGTIFAVLLVMYGIGTLLLSGFREHAS
ncbi:capsule biosynthesis protein [Muricoccus radiodurans]|uniref:capsule biosynthesis protein n=1 Tax=Muricoccus radiodurans TaxID=2231721 RepID=UPI003CEB4C13